jgi:hypothetical protein
MKKFTEKEKGYNHDNALNFNKSICDEVKNKLKEESMNLKRYKILVHCVIGKVTSFKFR